jgi:hypothetical protein
MCSRITGKVLQILLVVFNLIAMLFGILLIAGYVSVSKGVSNTSELHAFSMGSVGAGAAALIIGATGLVAACCRSRCSLILYGIVLMALICIHLYIGGVAADYTLNKGKVKASLNDTWNSMTKIERLQVQQNNGCCGFDSLTDRNVDVCDAKANPCAPILIQNTTKAMKEAAAYSFIAVVVELVAMSISFYLSSHPEKMLSGYGKYYV